MVPRNTTHPRTCGISIPPLKHYVISISPSASFLFPLAAWRSRSASLCRCIRCEIATWVITVIWKYLYLQTSFFTMNNLFVPPTVLAATTWSIRSLPSFPRKQKRPTARLAILYLRSSKKTCPGRA